MARIRNIKPSFFKDEDIAGLDPLTRILFEGLWCLADREGRLPDRPRWVKVECLPYDDVDIDAMLEVLHESGFIARYEADDRPYVQILSFTRHQAPNLREPLSEIPEPSVEDLTEAINRKNALTCHPISREVHARADSRAGIVSHVHARARTCGKEGKGKEGDGNARARANQPHEGFAEFYAAYPTRCTRRVREEALKAWNKHTPSLDVVLAAIAWQDAEYADWQKPNAEGKYVFIEAPAVWINQHLWTREQPVAAGPGLVSAPLEKPALRDFAHYFDEKQAHVASGAPPEKFPWATYANGREFYDHLLTHQAEWRAYADQRMAAEKQAV